jgi:hypothetical protein
VDDDTVRQQAPAAEAELLDLPFESDMKSFAGGSTAPAAAAGMMLGPSRLSLVFDPLAGPAFVPACCALCMQVQALPPCFDPKSTHVLLNIFGDPGL